MTLRVIREPSVSSTTLGVVFIDDRFQCFSLEDQIRERLGVPVAQWKVPGQTAIPAGQCRVAMTFSPRFQRVTPELLNVPGFTGIRIHAGNRHVDTEGCLLFGVQRAGVVISESRKAVAEVEAQISAALAVGAPVLALIENPLSWAA